MKIVVETPQRLELRGVPHGAFVLLGGAVVCPLLTGGVVVILSIESSSSHRGWSTLTTIPLMAALVFSVGMWLMCVAMSFRRQRLVLDRVTKTGEHTVRWVAGLGKTTRTRFDFSMIRGVTLEFSNSRSSRRAMPAVQKRSRILLDKPRRAIVLEDSEGGFDGRVEPLAHRVSAWLEMPLTTRGNSSTA